MLHPTILLPLLTTPGLAGGACCTLICMFVHECFSVRSNRLSGGVDQVQAGTTVPLSQSVVARTTCALPASCGSKAVAVSCCMRATRRPGVAAAAGAGVPGMPWQSCTLLCHLLDVLSHMPAVHVVT